MRLDRLTARRRRCSWPAASPAFADATVFIGSTNTPSNARRAKGSAFGAGFLVVGFEFEYADTSEERARRRAIAANRHGQRAAADADCDPRLPAVFHDRRRRLSRVARNDCRRRTVGVNTGGGVKIALAGPLRARVDYRVFRLKGDPLYDTVHRVYAGLNINF